jgi:Predicted signal transduction protein containing a membrane domain, an EAL and a GGDEF domain
MNKATKDITNNKLQFLPGHFSGEIALSNNEPDISDLLNNVFIPTWENRPDPVPDVMSLNGTGILTFQNVGSLIAKPGAGKTSVIEAIISSYLNPEGDNLGFEVDNSFQGIICIDNERTETDVWNSYYRIARRSNIAPGIEMKNMLLAGLRSVPRLQNRRAAITHLLENNPCSLLLIDGAGDLVNDTNDLDEAIECRIWLRELTVKYKISIFVTLHPNPGSEKPRGHHGSEICRESESVLIIKAFDENTRIITSDFEHGKNRNNAPVSTAFTWSDNEKMFISADMDNVAAIKQNAKRDRIKSELSELVKKVLAPPKSLGYNDLVSAIEEKCGISKSTAKRKVADMVEKKLIIKHSDDHYRAL